MAVIADIEILKVSTKSSPNAVAGAIAGAVRSSGAVVIQVVGAGALNQATKAAVIARGILATNGFDIVVVPSFADIEIDGEQRTALRLRIEPRDPVIDLTTPSLGAAIAARGEGDW